MIDDDIIRMQRLRESMTPAMHDNVIATLVKSGSGITPKPVTYNCIAEYEMAGLNDIRID